MVVGAAGKRKQEDEQQAPKQEEKQQQQEQSGDQTAHQPQREVLQGRPSRLQTPPSVRGMVQLLLVGCLWSTLVHATDKYALFMHVPACISLLKW